MERSSAIHENKWAMQRVIKQGTPREIAGDELARKILELEQLEDKKTNFMAEYKMDKERLLTDVKNISHIIRNYGPMFETVDTDTGEIK